MQVTAMSGEATASSRKWPSIGASIESMGRPSFDAAFLNYLQAVCDAEHFALYHIEGDELYNVSSNGFTLNGVAGKQAKLYASGGFWRHDPGLAPLWSSAADGRPIIAHMDIDEIEHDEMRERIYRPHGVRERVVLSARLPQSAVAISLLRTQKSGPFAAHELATLSKASEDIVAIAMKHVDMKQSSTDASAALTSLPAIQACLSAATPVLARREAEVCARILYGMTSLGIALDLGIGEESAMTYRKRAYSRLNIGSQRELLLWYLVQWSDQRNAVATSKLQ